MPAIERTNFYKLIERNAKVEHGDLGVGDLKIKPSIRKRSDNANSHCSWCRRQSQPRPSTPCGRNVPS